MMRLARPAKRPGEPGEPTPDAASAPQKSKLPRLDRGPEDFSNVVKNKLSTYTRTGQACDRCKVRKIRCDALPEGCSHCTSQNLECYVTDRVTGRTERRGYLQQLERERNGMAARIRDLEQLLGDNGVEVRPSPWLSYGDPYGAGVAYDNLTAAGHPLSDHWSQMGSVWFRSNRARDQGSPRSPPRSSVLENRPPKSYLGVTSDDSPLSSIKGTTLSILGTTIDIMSFDAPDMGQCPPGSPPGTPLYNKSVMAFFQTILNINPPLGNVELPTRQDAFTYTEWYFLVVHPFIPLLHKPSFLATLTRLYDDPSFRPPVAELVMVHMVFATIYFQYGVRNREEPGKQSQLNDLSNKHYHWCLSKFFDLATSQTVASLQALTMIAAHTRSFPKPGCSAMLASFAFSKAIELNLHRAAKVSDGGTNKDNEIRKRIWWGVLALSVTLNGRLGRPMPITLNEFDAELPLAVPDEYLTDNGISCMSNVGHCDYTVGLVGYKIVPLYLQLYSTIYSVRRDPSIYVETVRSLEDGIRSIEDNLLDELRLDKCKPANQVFALYAQAMILEFRLCLRHPSVCMTDDPDFCAENTRTTEEVAGRLLKVVGSLLTVKSLDTTWYQLSVYVAAIFSTLAAHWERRYETTPSEMAKLKNEMKMWMDIVNEIGRLLDSGFRLRKEVGNIIDRTVLWIERDMTRKESNASSHQAASQVGQHVQSRFQQAGLVVNPHGSASTASRGGNASNQQQPDDDNGRNAYYDPGGMAPATRAAYPPSLSYGNQPASAGSHGQEDGGGIGGPGSYDPTNNASYLYAASAAAVDQAAAVALVTQSHPIVFSSSVSDGMGPGGPATTEDWRTSQPQTEPLLGQQVGNPWHDWAAAIADSQTDRFSANALLTLGAAGRASDVVGAQESGSGSGGHVGMVGVAMDVGEPGASQASTHSQWPLLLFTDGPPTLGGS